MATIYDVAKRAGVSTYTVSAVLNRSAYVSPELTLRVEQAVRELDYTVNDLARSLQTRKTKTVGMLIPNIASPFYADVVHGVEDVLKQSGYSLILGNTYDKREEQSRYLMVFRSKQVDGLLLFVAPGDDAEVRALVEARKPVVFVARRPLGFEADSVTPDNVRGTQLAVEHFIGKGHKRIALITGPLGLSAASDRVIAWRRALKKAGLPAPKQWIGECDWTPESAYRVTLDWMASKERPTAIFTGNFLMLTGVLRALRERKLRCPQQVEVMNSDDLDWLDLFEPRISAVVQPSYAMGAQAAELLLKRIKEPDRRFEQIVLEPELKLRS
ncbi:MAG: LacI family DNA-binding transcriptional regulator [Bryobacteraceae bacterium]